MTTIILICGWLAGNPRHIQKYAALYEKLGYKTFIIYSARREFFQSTEYVHANTFETFKKWLSTEKIDGNDVIDIIPHTFSNGGCRSWICFQQHLSISSISYRIPGMIMDSAPTKFHAFELGHRAFTANIKNPLFRHSIAGLMWLFAAIYIVVLMAFGSESPLDLQYKRIFHQDAAIPKLFLYSDTDIMITPDNVESAIADAKSMESEVTIVKFKESKHVAHFTLYPELYTEAVNAFVGKYSPHFAAAKAH